MWNFADRVVKAVSDVTFGTVIVLVHVALADRSRRQLVLGTPGQVRDSIDDVAPPGRAARYMS